MMRVQNADWMFEVVFDFGDEGYRRVRTDEGEESVVQTSDVLTNGWPARRDPFSTYRSGSRSAPIGCAGGR